MVNPVDSEYEVRLISKSGKIKTGPCYRRREN